MGCRQYVRVTRRRLAPFIFLVLAACGGTSQPVPAPPPPPPPPPPAPTSPFDTFEFRQNVGLDEINAIPAYEAGLTGVGVIVGVADTGIDINQTEFAGRISLDSRNFIEGGAVIDSTAAALCWDREYCS